ncbi:uncharacterized protein LOC120152794 [Hibiscus syriacus]|uniref:uncharacterized protein LOC120152794 n=1 Tax=Hibiscus syriacus TaxID=106335 RepID=UPI0019224A7E|nr:uncharacterized protein LOC120152794 [Hibiscus syriacus]
MCSAKRPLKVASWSRPPSGFVNANVDDTMGKWWSKGGIGGMIRDEKGVTLGSFSEGIGSGPLIMAELMVAKKGLNLFLDLGMSAKRRLILEFDSAVAVDWIKNPASSTPMFLSLVKDITKIVVDKSVIVLHVVRAVNCEAYQFAKLGMVKWRGFNFVVV